MKVYVVMGYWYYDSADPIAVFDTEEAAEECAKTATGFDFYEVKPLTLNATN